MKGEFKRRIEERAMNPKLRLATCIYTSDISEAREEFPSVHPDSEYEDGLFYHIQEIYEWLERWFGDE